jgi:type IV secretory pathway VirB4 component
MVDGPAPAVLLNKDGAYMATLRYRGADVTMMEQGERVVYLHRLNTVLKRLGTGWALLADEWHEPSQDYPSSTWTNPAACLLDASRRSLMASGVLHESRQYLTLTWKPPSTRKQRLFAQWFTTDGLAPSTDAENRQSCVHSVSRFMDTLAGVVPEGQWLTPDETVTYLKNTVGWDREPIALPAIPMYLDCLLTTGDFLPGHTPQLGRMLPGSQPPRPGQAHLDHPVKTWTR